MLYKVVNRWASRPGTRRAHYVNYFRWRFFGQWKVGEDDVGNEYMLYQPFVETPIRRFCAFKRGQIGLDDMPFLWYQWIRYQRDFPPTADELLEYDQYLIETQEKAKYFQLLDDQKRIEEGQYLTEQKARLDIANQQLTEKVQQDVIAMFSNRENALRIAAENKLRRMQDVEEAMKEDQTVRHRREKQRLQQIFDDPQSTQPRSFSRFADSVEAEDSVNRTDNLTAHTMAMGMAEAAHQQSSRSTTTEPEPEPEPEPATVHETSHHAQQQPTMDDSQPFKPGAWRPWSDNDNENEDEDNDDSNNVNENAAHRQ